MVIQLQKQIIQQQKMIEELFKIVQHMAEQDLQLSQNVTALAEYLNKEKGMNIVFNSN